VISSVCPSSQSYDSKRRRRKMTLKRDPKLR